MSKQFVCSTPPGIHNVVVISAGFVRLETALGLRQRSIENIFVTCRTCASSTGGASNRPSY